MSINIDHISAAEVDLLIFDLDGTISSTTRPIYEAVKRAFARLDLTLRLTPEEMERYFGAPSPQFYVALTPPDSGVTWQKLKETIHEEQTDTYRQFGETYPGVNDTLDTLRKREYKLALFSNSTPGYFDTVIDALGIRDLFDYAECIGENDITKSELARKIKEKFGSPGTAVVGDRIHDIEAARANNCLSVGSLYGYGGDEPKQADITINEFSDLLGIFDRRLPVFSKILSRITALRSGEQPLVVGITGIDASGKTSFTEGLYAYLTAGGYPVQVIHLDDFHNPRSVRYSGEDQADNYFNKSFNIKVILDELLIPSREKGSYSKELTLLDLVTDKYSVRKRYTFSPDTIVLLEGVFLFRNEFSPYLDYSVYLDISFEECLKRGMERGGKEERYQTKYISAQRKYLAWFSPSEHADIIIDNSNWHRPSITLIP